MKEYSFKRSMFGYDPDSVSGVIAGMEDEYRKRLKIMKDELAGEAHQLQLLKVEVDKLKGEINSYKFIEDDLYSKIAGFHLDAAKKVFSAIREAERLEKSAADRVLLKKDELNSVLLTAEKIREEITHSAGRYKFQIEGMGEE